MVEYVFSDKTGTLTQNIMEFRKFTAGMKNFGTNEKPTVKQESNVNFHDPNFHQVLNGSGKDSKDLDHCMTFLSLCHTIVVDKNTNAYNAASPDELALVNFAKQMNYEFKDIDKDDNMIVDIPKKGLQKYKLLHVCEFTSSRKRMSVIVKDLNDGGKIKLFCKGADSIIKARLSKTSIISPEMAATQ